MTIDDARVRAADGLAREGMSRRELARLMSGGLAALSWQGLGGAGAPSVHAAQNAMRRDGQGAAIQFRLSSNENNYGLAPAAVAALNAGRSYANRYSGDSVGRLTDVLAKAHGVERDYVLVTPGSGEILRAVTLAFTGTSKGLLTASPTFESPERTAHRAKAPIKALPVAKDGSLDLVAMAGAATPETGLAFICNPNNPTGTVNSGASVEAFYTKFRAAAPDAYVLFDEAYFEYVTDSSYATAVPLVASDRRVIVSRTFSKIHGMAGLRVGYAIGHPDALALVRDRTSSGTLSSVSAGAALASLEDPTHLQRQRQLNKQARNSTRNAFEKAGYQVFPSQANFIMVDVRRPSTEFSTLCRQAGVGIARPFPPLTNHARITIGTVEEMKTAVALMIPLLSAPAKGGGSSGSSAASFGPEDDDYGC